MQISAAEEAPVVLRHMAAGQMVVELKELAAQLSPKLAMWQIAELADPL